LYSANLAKPELSDEARARFAGRAAEQLKRLERLIQDVLLFARGESIGREAIALESWLADVVQTVEPLFAAKGVQLASDSQVDAAVIVGGRKPLTGALINLLENALQVSEPGERVCLAARLVGASVRISVRDQGPGIAVETQARVFEPFYTTRGQGTGLGLAIALGVARAHGGTIEVASNPGESERNGAEFILSLPAGQPDELVPMENR
jgi:two-component system sensor histidine kinase FlrB